MDDRGLGPADLIDYALELSVVGSFSNIGPAVRRRVQRWSDPPAGALRGRTVLVTGPTSGLGLAAAHDLAALGARVALVGRDEQRLVKLANELAEKTGEERFPTYVIDMASLDSVRAGTRRILAEERRLDVLVDNAGAMHAERSETADGIEKTLAVLVVGPFVLISELMPLLKSSRSARVIAVTSGGMYAQPVDLDDLDWRSRPYNGTRAYAQAKRIQVALIREWARRTAGSDVAFNAMHPGWTDTPGLAEALPGFHRLMRPVLRTPSEGVDTITWLATSNEAVGSDGLLYLDRRPRPFDRVPATRLSAADRAELWDDISSLAARGIAD